MGKEYNNVSVDLFCKSKGIKHEFSTFRTPQKNRVAKNKNKNYNVIRNG